MTANYGDQYQDRDGKWRRNGGCGRQILLLLIVVLLGFFVLTLFSKEGAEFQKPDLPCKQISEDHWDCSDPDAAARWRLELEKNKIAH